MDGELLESEHVSKLVLAQKYVVPAGIPTRIGVSYRSLLPTPGLIVCLQPVKLAQRLLFARIDELATKYQCPNRPGSELYPYQTLGTTFQTGRPA